MMQMVFRVPSIKCEGCADTIRRALATVPGVTSTRVQTAEREVQVEFDPSRVDEDSLRRSLAGAGFPVA